MTRTVLLASASPSRYSLLSAAGIIPVVQVSHVDEVAIEALMPSASTSQVCSALAQAKGEAVAADITVTTDTNVLIIAADSMLEFEGHSFGKPEEPDVAFQRWQVMRGKTGTLRTAHWVKDCLTNQVRTGVAGAIVHFAEISDDEIRAYVATGEPLNVAGAFTHEGYSAAFISKIDGDSPAVGGLSLHLLRNLTADMGITWHTLWNRH